MPKTKVWRPEEDDAEEQKQARKTGTIKFYIEDKGYGFITQDKGEDHFFHISQSDIEEPSRLSRGCVVSYEVSENNKGLEAINLSIEKEARKTEQSNMANNFLDNHIREGNQLLFVFIDNTEVEAVLIGYDRYNIFVEINGKERMVFKHSLKFVE